MHKPFEQKEIEQFGSDEPIHEINYGLKQKLMKEFSQRKNKKIEKIQQKLSNKKLDKKKQKWHYEKNDYVFYGLGKHSKANKRIKDDLIVKIPLNF